MIAPITGSKRNGQSRKRPAYHPFACVCYGSTSRPHNGFEIPLAEEIESATDNCGFLYQPLCVKSDNELNRDELRVMTQQLQEMA